MSTTTNSEICQVDALLHLVETNSTVRDAMREILEASAEETPLTLEQVYTLYAKAMVISAVIAEVRGLPITEAMRAAGFTPPENARRFFVRVETIARILASQASESTLQLLASGSAAEQSYMYALVTTDLSLKNCREMAKSKELEVEDLTWDIAVELADAGKQVATTGVFRFNSKLSEKLLSMGKDIFQMGPTATGRN